jgi:hypothetical protein
MIMIIQAKVKCAFDEQNVLDPDLKVPSFVASAWWFRCFKGHHKFHDLELTGESCQSTDLEPSASAGWPAQLDLAPVSSPLPASSGSFDYSFCKL